MKKLWRFSLRLLFLIFFAVISANAQAHIGYVLEVEGDWSLNGSAESLTPGKKLPAAGAIRLRSNSSRAAISIADMNGKIIISKNCAAQSCARAFTLPRQSSANVLGFFSSWMEWFFGSPAKYSAHRIRGGEISDGVLLTHDGKIDFTPVLATRGEVYLRWRDVTKNDAGEWSKEVKVEKSENGFAPLKTSDLKPGLYEVDLLRKSVGEIYEPISTAWILVRDSSDYQKSLASFRRAVELTKNWDGKLKPETTRTFLQAYLDQLAQISES
jgi:hypothetical protein